MSKNLNIPLHSYFEKVDFININIIPDKITKLILMIFQQLP